MNTNIEEKNNHLNGFTIISFNYNNKYVLFKSEIYEFNNGQQINNNEIINNEEPSLTDVNYVYWIIKEDNQYKILISKDTELAPSNYFMGPFYDKNTISIMLSYLNGDIL